VSKKISPQLIAILQALLVTFLWSTSWVLIKIGLEDIPALTFAGLRYTLAFLVLLPFALRSKRATPLKALTGKDWLWLVALGLLFYTIAQGAQFVTLQYLPAITLSLLMNSIAIFVALLGMPLLGERTTWLQWLGIGVFTAGALAYFYPPVFPAAVVFGYVMAAVNILSNSVSTILGRFVNRSGHLHPLTVTVVSMGVGGVLMLVLGVVIEGFPQLSWQSWAIIAWLAVVNTALTFPLWNHTLRTLTATQSSVINNTMLIQVAVLAWIFLGERIDLLEGIGLVVSGVGVLLVQLRRKPKAEAAVSSPR